MKKLKYLILMLVCSLIIPANSYAKGCCAWVGVTGGVLDSVGSIGIANLNPAQVLQITKAIGNMGQSVKGQVELSSKSLQELLKFNNTSLIESIKDIKKAEKIAEKMEYVNTISKDLCDEPDTAASVQNGYKGAASAGGSYGSKLAQNTMGSSEIELEKKTAEIDLREKDPTKANASTLDEEGMIHQKAKDAIVSKRYATDYNKIREQITNADTVANQALLARANALAYEHADYSTAQADFIKHHSKTIEKTDSIQNLISNISGKNGKNKEAIKEFSDDKLSLISYSRLRSLQSILDPEAALKRIGTNQNSLLGEIHVTLQQMLYYQLYQVEMMERIEKRLLATPSVPPDKTVLEQ